MLYPALYVGMMRKLEVPAVRDGIDSGYTGYSEFLNVSYRNNNQISYLQK